MDTTILKMLYDHKTALAAFEEHGLSALGTAAVLTTGCLRKGGKVLLCGNGGSAADCQHVAGELVGRFRQERRGLPAIALTTDASVMTSISNDYTFENAFARVVDALATENDVLWAFSTSGTSKNILAAANAAKDKKAQIVAFTGTPSSPLEQLADVCICSATEHTSTAQEIHQLAYHIICNLVEKAIVDFPV